MCRFTGFSVLKIDRLLFLKKNAIIIPSNFVARQKGGIFLFGVKTVLHENIRYARKQCGFTQQQVADYLGIKRSSYTYYETGHTQVPVDYLAPLSRLFGVSIDWLLTHRFSLESDDDLLPGVADRSLPGLARLTNEERELLLLLRKYDLTGSVKEYIKTLTQEKQENA